MNESQKPDPSRQTSSGQADPAPSIHTGGDYVGGDKAGGDKVMGNKIVQYITKHPAIAPEKDGVRVYEHGRYNLASQFVGRKKELQELDDWQADASRPMFVIVALGGTGKSALTWHWLETVKARAEQPFKLIIWHGFYETGQVDTFLTDVLEFLGEKPQELGSKWVQLNRLLERLAATPSLLVLDGAERLLRAYGGLNAAYQGDEEQQVQRALECVDPVAGELLLGLSQLGNGSKTLMTTRLLPQKLLGPGGRLPDRIGRRDLTGLDQDAAYNFFIEWGIRTTRAEVNAVCAPLDYHPFSMALLAGLADDDFEKPGDLRAAADYPTVKLIDGQQHILQRAYNTLSPETQYLLSCLAVFRNAVNRETVKAVFGSDDQRIEDNLKSLIRRGFVQRSPETKGQSTTLDLHPIVRRYAYKQLADPIGIHNRLIDYYKDIPMPSLSSISSLAELVSKIEQYHHLTCVGRYDEAIKCFRESLASPLFKLGAYHTRIELLEALFQDGLDELPQLSSIENQLYALNALAISYSKIGQIEQAGLLGEKHNTLAIESKYFGIWIHGLNNRSAEQWYSGQLKAMASSLINPIMFCWRVIPRTDILRPLEILELQSLEAVSHSELGLLFATIGKWEVAQTELNIALNQFERVQKLGYQTNIWTYKAMMALWQGKVLEGLDAAKLAFENVHNSSASVARHLVQAYWIKGWAYLELGELLAARQLLGWALRRCRSIDLVEFEPAILLAQARLAHALKQTDASHTYAQEAIFIAERSDYKLYLADCHNHLALLALDEGDTVAARHHAQTARDYAYCDGPPYAYQPALDEAERLLNTLSQA